MPEACSLIIKANGSRPGKISGRSRAVALLDYPSNKYVNLPEAFDELTEAAQRYLHASFDSWTSFIPKAGKRYHSYGNDYKDCMHFRQNDFRFYGFVTHLPKNDRFELCVLVSRVEKHERNTDYSSESRSASR